MTIIELERELIKTREKLKAEEQSHNAEIRRIAAELGFPLGGVTVEQIIGRIRELRTKLDRHLQERESLASAIGLKAGAEKENRKL